jgi:long-chain acyl-CoA synthetase
MKLAQGEYVALEKIENMYIASNVVGQIYVHGDSLQSYLIAVVVPDLVHLSAAAWNIMKMKVKPEDTKTLRKACADERMNEYILTALKKEAKKNGLKGCGLSFLSRFSLTFDRFEYIKRVHLTVEPFTIENGTLTPTFKVRRKDAYNMYKEELDGLYALGEPSTTKM